MSITEAESVIRTSAGSGFGARALATITPTTTSTTAIALMMRTLVDFFTTTLFLEKNAEKVGDCP
jgi:hypothetical protein